MLSNSEEHIDSDVELTKNMLLEDELEDDVDTEALSKELEEQKKKIAEINSMMNDSEEIEDTNEEEKNTSDENLDENELFDLIDSMYEKKDDE